MLQSSVEHANWHYYQTLFKFWLHLCVINKRVCFFTSMRMVWRDQPRVTEVYIFNFKQLFVIFCCGYCFPGGRFVVQEDGLQILNATDADSGNYTCRAEVDELGNYAEQFISVAVNSEHFLLAILPQHICYSALYAIARPSVCPSVRPSVHQCVCHRVDQSKAVVVTIMQLSQHSSPMTSFLTVNFTVKFQRKHREQGVPNARGVGKICNFQPISGHISETVQDRTKVTIND